MIVHQWYAVSRRVGISQAQKEPEQTFESVRTTGLLSTVAARKKKPKFFTTEKNVTKKRHIFDTNTYRTGRGSFNPLAGRGIYPPPSAPCPINVYKETEMNKVINWMLFFAVLAVLAVYGGSEQPANTTAPAWDAAKTRQEVEAEVAWMKRMNAVEAEQAAREAESIKAVEEADRSDWHPPYEPTGE